jgi:hypothetical protein
VAIKNAEFKKTTQRCFFLPWLLELQIIKKNTPEKYATRNNSPKKFRAPRGKRAPYLWTHTGPQIWSYATGAVVKRAARSLARWLAGCSTGRFLLELMQPARCTSDACCSTTLVKHTSRRTNEHTTQIKCTLARRQLRRVLLLFNVSLGPKEDESCGRAHFRKLNSTYVIHHVPNLRQIYKQNMLILPCHNISSLVITESSMHSKICFRI